MTVRAIAATEIGTAGTAPVIGGTGATAVMAILTTLTTGTIALTGDIVLIDAVQPRPVADMIDAEVMTAHIEIMAIGEHIDREAPIHPTTGITRPTGAALASASILEAADIVRIAGLRLRIVSIAHPMGHTTITKAQQSVAV